MKRVVWQAGLGLAMAAMAWAAGGATGPPDPDEAAYPALERFVEVMERVRKSHPDVDKVTYDRLVNHALEGMLEGLDPFSSFIHPEMARLMQENADLDPGVRSLGLSLGLRDDGPYIQAVSPQGPASQAGILPGSALLAIDGRAVAGTGFAELVAELTRPAGSLSKLTLKSPVEPKPVEVALTHRLVEERSVVEARMWDEARKIGYVRLASFGRNCAAEMEAALDELEDKGMKSLVFDLRQNGGGDLNETVKLLGLFVAPGTEVVTTRGRGGQVLPPMKTPDRQRRKRDYPVAVLIDRMSASASELTAGALQDLKRAKVLGETSYGKGSVQSIIPTSGGTALRLTIATYHTPSGRTPHGKGITPDETVSASEEDRRRFLMRCRIDSLGPDDRRAVEAWKDPVIEAAVAGW